MSQKLTMKAVQAIMNKRILVPSKMEGRTVQLTVQGNGTTVDVKNAAGELVQSVVEEGTVFQKKIFNCKANSELAMKNARNKEILVLGIKAERAGNPKEADKHFSDFLNKVQFSFNIPLPSTIADLIGNGSDIAAKVQKIVTEKGELLTIDPKSIRVMEPEMLGNTDFTFDDFEDELTASEEEPALKAEDALTA